MTPFSRSTVFLPDGKREQRLAIDFHRLGIDHQSAEVILCELALEGVIRVHVNMFNELRAFVQNSTFLPNASMKDAVRGEFDCASFVKRGYDIIGVRIPRTITHQLRGIPVPLSNLRPGDLIFRTDTGMSDEVAFEVPQDDDPDSEPQPETVVHVGMATDDGHVLHCAGRGPIRGVFEVPQQRFLSGKFAIRRHIPDFERLVTLVLPSNCELEEDIDILGRIAREHWTHEFIALPQPNGARHSRDPITVSFQDENT